MGGSGWQGREYVRDVSALLQAVAKQRLSWSPVTTGGQSVSTSSCRAHCGTCDQILIPSEIYCLVCVGRPLWREVGSVHSQSLLAVIIHRQVFPIFFFVFFQAQYSRSYSIICSLNYNSSYNKLRQLAWKIYIV
jgi:hypothetical protein